MPLPLDRVDESKWPAPCTAIAHQFSSPCGDASVRRFCSALFPDGPEMRLCQRHADVFYSWCIAACDELERARNRDEALTRFERICDEWRYQA